MKVIDGHPFECTQCGDCCRWEGVVKLTPEDIKKLSDHLGINENECKNKYTRDGEGKILADKRDTTACVFLKDNKCSIWNAKPKQCNEYPTKYTKRCPGFNNDRSASMSVKYEDAVRMVREKMASSDDYLSKVSEGLFKELQAGVKSSSVASMAIQSGMDCYLDNNTVKIASMEDLFAFDRVSKDHLIHKSTKDLWAIGSDNEGNVQITRLFDNSGEPVKG